MLQQGSEAAAAYCALAVFLSIVHGRVGHSHQRLGVVAVDRCHGKANGEPHLQLQMAQCERLLKSPQQRAAQLLGLLEESDAARARLQARVERLPPVSRSAVAAEGRRAGPVRLALRGTGVSGTGADEGSVDLPSERRRRVVPLPPGMNDRRVSGAGARLRALT